MAFQNDAALCMLIFKDVSDFIGILIQNRSVRRNDKNTVCLVFLSLYEGEAQRRKRFTRAGKSRTCIYSFFTRAQFGAAVGNAFSYFAECIGI